MKDKLEHHPDVTRFAMENLELRGNSNILRRLASTRKFLSVDCYRKLPLKDHRKRTAERI